jgi:two-component system, chemotaxis family, chemotaxis protein CheY
MSYNFDRLRVLVVDDNLHIRTLVSAVTTVLEATSGEEAWKILTENRCDLIFADWVMSGISGLDLAVKIRTAADSPNQFVPIVMITGHTSPERVHAARDAGVNEFLAKPVSSKSIMARVVSVIENPRPFVRTKSYFGPCRRRRHADYHGPERRVEENIVKPGKKSANAA